MRSKIIYLMSLAIVGLCLTGCAAFQTSTTQNLPSVVGEKPTPDKALIIVEGSDSWGGIYKLYAVKVYDNKTFVGKVGPHGKLAWLRDPGPMDISMNGVIGRRLPAEAGETYHFKINCNSSLVYSVGGPGVAFDYVARQTLTQEPYDYNQSIQGQYYQQQNQQQIHDAAKFRNQYNNSMKR